jgi:hypothetical protein
MPASAALKIERFSPSQDAEGKQGDIPEQETNSQTGAETLDESHGDTQDTEDDGV